MLGCVLIRDADPREIKTKKTAGTVFGEPRSLAVRSLRGRHVELEEARGDEDATDVTIMPLGREHRLQSIERVIRIRCVASRPHDADRETKFHQQTESQVVYRSVARSDNVHGSGREIFVIRLT